MIPSAFVIVDALPLTPNGKVDRTALPAPDAGRVATVAEYVAPRTPTETAIAAAWSDILGVERVGLRDDFFDLGGHSLLATQVASRLRDALGVEVPVRLLFEASTVEALAARLGAEAHGDPRLIAPPIRPAAREGAPPLSFAQESLWYLDQLVLGQPTFNVSAALRIAGPLDIEALRRAFEEVVRRHESLRTTFAVEDGRPVQAIAPSLPVPLEIVDLAGLPPEQRQAEAERRAEAEARRPFDLAAGPLFRATVFRLGEVDHTVLLAMHHIITDGWSFGVAAAELSALYRAFREGRPSPLPAPAIQYADYAIWQRDWLRGEAKEALLAYWRAHLEGVRPLELPTDRPRPPVRSARGDLRRFTLSRELSAAVVELGGREGTTPFMTLLAAFQLLLGRTSGQDRFAVGSPIANRNRVEVEGLVGYFINMLALRADLSGDPTFRELLGRVREAALGGYEHQDLPLELLVEALHPERDPSRTPLFQAMFVLQNNELPDAIPDGLEFEPFGTAGTGTAKFDLSLALAETPDGLDGSIEYATDLFDAATIDLLIGRFRALLAAVVAEPDRRASDLDLAPDDDLRTLEAWNATETPVAPDATLHGLFEAQVRRTPDAEAVAFAGRSLTYRELDERANRLARMLYARGVGVESRVGIAMGRSLNLAVALLGTLKAGAAFVPLDPAYPRARLDFMRDDARLAVVLTDRDGLGRWDGAGIPTLCVGEDEEDVDGSLDIRINPESAAYVIYTSGSTGEPRGVVVPHQSVVNHALDAVRRYGLGPGDRVLQFASLSFDIAVEEIFPAWSSGASVVFRGEEIPPPAEFARWVGAEGITVLDLPTAFWHAWVAGLAEAGARLPEGLRLVIVGGEEALAASYEAWLRVGGDRVRWVNTYGPTEATVVATAFEPEEGKVPATIPIGTPIANARAYVLDATLRPVPIGVSGELCLGGLGVARAYLNRPGLTAERFLPDPFGPPGSRLYRTGDRARWRADGRIEFLGRLDDQLKVRGFRVEPGEVESAILGLPGVREAAVAPRGGVLAAYVVPRDGAEIDPHALRRALRDRLPRHLVPAAVVTLAALPMTPSGKVDRAALPDPARSDVDREVVAPRDAVEARLLAIWEEILPARPIGVTDDFFDLGGHSLLAIRLLARVEAEFGRRPPLASLYRGASVEDLARWLGDRDGVAACSPLVGLHEGQGGRPFFCVHGADGLLFPFHELARRVGDHSFFGVQPFGLEGDDAPSSTVEEMAERYVAAILREHPRGPYHLGGWSLGGHVAFEMARRLTEGGHEIATLAILDTPTPDGAGLVVPPALRPLAAEFAELGIFEGPPGDPEDDAILMEAVIEGLSHDFVGGVRGMIDHLRALDPGRRRLFLLRPFKLDHLHDPVSEPERLRRAVAVLRANVIAGAKYRPSRPYPGRIVVFRASKRKRVTDTALGWGRLAAEVTDHEVPGDHVSILGPPGVDALAATLRRAMDEAERGIA
jgi:amino acid adenylation domain-containing protein